MRRSGSETLSRGAAVLLALLFAGTAGVPVAAEAEDRKPRLIVLLSIDTLRADHMSAYGYERETTPVLEDVARRGFRVRQVVSPMPTTDPAHTSMLTGLYPRTHGIRINGQPLANPDVATLSSWARRLGYTTGAFVSRGMLAPSQLELPGFDHEDAPATPQRDGAETLENALAWLDEQGDKPVFLWLHFFDPHLPYEPPEDFAGLFAPPGTPELVDLENPFGRAVYSAEQIQAHIDRYDEEIAYTDHLVGRFLKALEAHLPSGESPLIAIAADHGEAMGELDARYRFAFDHGKFLYQSIVGVPLLFLWEGHIPAGVSIAGPAQLLDIAPTLADLIGDPGFENQGRSLAPYMHGQPQPEDWLAFIERRTLPLTKQLRFAARKQFAARDQRYKLILSTPLARTQLYDLKEDPGELHDLSGTLPEIEARLLAALEKWLATAAESGEWTTTVPDEKVEMLKALGYIDD